MATDLMPDPIRRRIFRGLGLLLAALLLAGSGCSVKKMAINKLGDALAGGGTTFASDDDPELVKAAVPFSLKLIESLLAESPRHRGLLQAAASGFTQYSYAFVQSEADLVEDSDFAKASAMRDRAARLYLRARDYGLRGLALKRPEFAAELARAPRPAVRSCQAGDVPLLYWTAAAWGAAISLSKDKPERVAELPQVEALIDRALELDERFDSGAIHAFLIPFEMGRPGTAGDPAERARQHYLRAMELSGGQSAAPLVNYAESVCIQKQDLAQFKSLLEQALGIDPASRPEWRLANLIAQARARWLLGRVDELFLIDAESDSE